MNVLWKEIPGMRERFQPFEVEYPQEGFLWWLPRDIDKLFPDIQKWCLSEFGYRATARQIGQELWVYHPYARWDMAANSFFFANEKDATLFKIFWC